jgi:hypothetical protein
MFYGFGGLRSEAEAWHTDLLRQAAHHRLARSAARSALTRRRQWSSAMLIWLGDQLIG